MTENPGSERSAAKAWVTDWPDERSSALSLTFDDGYASHYKHLHPVLKENGLVATFFVVPGWLDDPSSSRYRDRIGTWPEFETMAIAGHEIGSHSMTHANLNQLNVGSENQDRTLLHELAESKRAIEHHVHTRPCTALAYPYALHNRKVDKYAAKYYIAARGIGNPFILVARAIIDLMDPERTVDEHYKPQRRPVSVFKRWYLTRRNRALQEQRAFYQVHGKHIDGSLLTRLTRNIETRAFGRGVWTVFVLHEVIPFSDLGTVDTFGPYPIEYFKPFAEWLQTKVQEGAVWVDTVSNVMKYMKERDTFHYKVLKEDRDTIEIEIHHGLDTTLYSYPLTIDVLIPDAWRVVSISTRGDPRPPEQHEAWIYEGHNYVRFNAVPGGQVLELRRS